jgi:FkbM family methyltransferase
METRDRNPWLRTKLKKLYYLSRPGPKCFRYFGRNVYFPPGSHLFNRVCEENIYERANLRVLRRFIGKGSTFFDIGANLGLIALPMLKECPDCSAVSFEPSPGILPYLRRTVSESGFGIRWRLVEVALGAAPGEAEFFTAGAGLSAFDGLRNTARKGDRHAVRVPVSTLDDRWSALGKPAVSAVKIDVEGGEADVLRGAEAMLAALRPAILLEWNPTNLAAYGCGPEWLLEWADAHSYGVYSVASGIPATDPVTLFLQGRSDDNFLLAPKG